MIRIPRFDDRQSGFTLLEILVAVAVLTVGILGVIALFPVAMRSGKMTIETTNAVLLAQSVEQAIRKGIQHRKGQSPDGRWTFFVFDHPGVEDPIPDRVEDAKPGDDYYVLFPDDDVDGRATRVGDRNDFYERGKLFVFPETDGKSWEFDSPAGPAEFEDESSSAAPNGGGSADRADNDGDDREFEAVLDGERQTFQTFEVFKVYEIDEWFLAPDPERVDVEEMDPRDRDDPIRDYGFAFTMRRALNDASLGRELPSEGRVIPANELYEVEILIFRSFVPGTNLALTPIFRTTILVQK